MSEVASKADFSQVRYAQCWEDADILLAGLAVRPGDVCLSIASAGDNSLALLLGDPARVLAVDLSPAQLACLELRVAAYRVLEHPQLLELIGSRPSPRRLAHYARCRPALSAAAREFWDAHEDDVARGIGHAGKFERYFRLFRTRILPLVHDQRAIARLLAGGTRQQRLRYYARGWDTWRWRALFRLFFSRLVMGRLGRDPSFFAYVEGSVSDRILARARHAVTELNPVENPYLQWIMAGRHLTALPLALREEHFATIRARLDRLEWRQQSLEEFLAQSRQRDIDKFNLSDIFEYMSEANYHDLLRKLLARGRPGGRLAYWNLLVPRSRPETLADRLRPLLDLAEQLHQQDKAFFYSRFVVEELLA